MPSFLLDHHCCLLFLFSRAVLIQLNLLFPHLLLIDCFQCADCKNSFGKLPGFSLESDVKSSK